MANTGSRSLATIIVLLFQAALLYALPLALVTDNVTVVDNEMTKISCRVINNKDNIPLVLSLTNPNGETIFFGRWRKLKDARFQLDSNSFQELRVVLLNARVSDEGRYVCTLYRYRAKQEAYAFAYAHLTVLDAPNSNSSSSISSISLPKAKQVKS